MSSIIITGFDGFLGSKITRKIINDTSFDVIGLTLSHDYANRMLTRENLLDESRIRVMKNDEFLCAEELPADIYGAVHLAFSRRMSPAADIASSIDFAASVFHALKRNNIDRIINMSSQGVYGNTSEIRTEETVPAPATQYTMAKYAAEVLFEDILKDCSHHTSFRLDPVAQSQNVILGLCKSAREGSIQLKGGKQVFSFIDADDVPSAVISMLSCSGDWERVYNVGWNRRRYSLIDIAELIADVAQEKGYPKPSINLVEDDTALWAGMDSSLFSKATGWHPTVSLRESIRSVFTIIE